MKKRSSRFSLKLDEEGPSASSYHNSSQRAYYNHENVLQISSTWCGSCSWLMRFLSSKLAKPLSTRKPTSGIFSARRIFSSLLDTSLKILQHFQHSYQGAKANCHTGFCSKREYLKVEKPGGHATFITIWVYILSEIVVKSFTMGVGFCIDKYNDGKGPCLSMIF